MPWNNQANIAQSMGGGYWQYNDRRNQAIKEEKKRKEQVQHRKEQAARNELIFAQDQDVALLNERRRKNYVPRSQRRRKFNMQSYSRELVMPTHESPDLQIG